MGRWSAILRALAQCALLASFACGEEEDDAPMLDAGACADGHSHSHGPSSCSELIDARAPTKWDGGDLDGSDAGYAWKLIADFAPPRVPADNPMTEPKVELGRHLFYDTRLSGNQTQSCASCHKQELAFADERAVGLGSTGELHTRSSMSLVNVAYSPTLTWGNPVMTTLEKQLHVPLLGDRPIELGMRSIADVEARLRAEPRYTELFANAYPGEAEAITMLNVERALASFERALVSFDSPFDRWYYKGDESAVSEAAKRGARMIVEDSNDPGDRFQCNHCHGGPNFSDHYADSTTPLNSPPQFHQTGLYNIDGRGSYPAPNTGIHDITGNRLDMGKFKAPSLRNIALTAPYMHDGSIATLSEVLDHYAKGGRARMRGVTDPLLEPFTMTEQEKQDILAFLESLTDRTITTDPRLSNPWLQPVATAKP